MIETFIAIGSIPLTPYGTPSTNEVPEAIAPYLKEHDVLLLQNHGALTVGCDLITAYYRMETLELFAKISLTAHLLGGQVPFGYHLVQNGRLNRKGYPISDLEVDVAEAEIVRMIFSKTICDGYGSYRLAGMLNDMCVKTHKGSKFQCITILRMLRNKMYCGYTSSGDATSPQLQNLRIIEDNVFERAQFILNQRSRKDDEKRQIAYNTKGKALLSGNAFCAHCGGRLTTIYYRDRHIRKDGSVYELAQIKYACYHKSRKLCECDGQCTYQAERIDEIVNGLIKKLFSTMKGAPEEEHMKLLFKRHIAGNKANQKKLDLDIAKSEKQLENLQMEIAKTLTGESGFSAGDLSAAIKTLKEHICTANQKLKELQEEEQQGMESIEKIKPAYMQFKSWAEEYDSATLEQKKMIVCQMFQRVEVGKDYKISFLMNTTYEQFCEEWEDFNKTNRIVV